MRLRTEKKVPIGIHYLNKQCTRYIDELKHGNEQIRIDLKASAGRHCDLEELLFVVAV